MPKIKYAIDTEGLDYNPDRLLNALSLHLHTRTDAALSRKLEVDPVVISRIRKWKFPVSAPLLIRMHELTGMHIRELRELMGDRRSLFRAGAMHFNLSH
jgi:hypothetical protein